jgi:hypothetical protein
MFAIPLARILLSRTALEIYGLLAIALFLHGMKHAYDERRRDEGRVEIQAKFDAYKNAATKRATYLALLWSASLDKIDTESRKRQEAEGERNQAFAQRAAALSRAPTIVISAAAARLWGDITPVGPAAPAEPSAPASDKPGAKAISESALVGFVNAAKAAYDDAVGLFHDAREALNACVTANRSSQPEVSP